MSSKQGGGSRASDEDGKTSVKVGEWCGDEALSLIDTLQGVSRLMPRYSSQWSVFAHLSRRPTRVST